MSNLNKDSTKRIFDSLEHLKYEYNLNVEIPKDIPEGCNVIGWDIGDLGYTTFYKEDEELLRFSEGLGYWENNANSTLEKEVSYDISNNYNCVYLRLAAKDNSDVFTSERLLGVETDKGFVEGIAYVDYNIYLVTGSHIISASRCKFYISDDSDETVSFEDYVRIFYEE